MKKPIFKVCTAFNVSKNARRLYIQDKLDNYLKALIPAAMSLSKSKDIESYIFSSSCKKIKNITSANTKEYIQTEVLNKNNKSILWNSTIYYTFISTIINNSFYKKDSNYFIELVKKIFIKENKRKDPILSIVTLYDLDLSKHATTNILEAHKDKSKDIYWFFIIIGKEKNDFIKHLEALYTNINFLVVPDILTIDKEQILKSICDKKLSRWVNQRE